MAIADNTHAPNRKLWLLPVLVAVGLLVALWQPFELTDLLGWGRQVSELPWVAAMVVLAMALCFTFGLPGSLGLWLIAPFQPPTIATAMLVTASVSGALGAYMFAKHLRGNWKPGGTAGKILQLLEGQGDPFTQTALRVLPGFPHSVLNFAGGVLLLPLTGFLAAALVGLTIKWAVYSFAVHGVVDAAETGSAVQASTVAPLVILSMLLLLGIWVRNRVTRNAAGE